MNKTSETSKDAADKLVRGIKRKTHKHYSAEEKIRVKGMCFWPYAACFCNIIFVANRKTVESGQHRMQLAYASCGII